MIDQASKVEAAADLTIKAAQIRAAVTRALALWETWIIILSVAYLLGHFGAWARRGFQVSNGEDAFAFFAAERAR